jgi:hypothetical protein
MLVLMISFILLPGLPLLWRGIEGEAAKYELCLSKLFAGNQINKKYYKKTPYFYPIFHGNIDYF